MLESSQKLSRISSLMAGLRLYLSPDKYNRLVRKIEYWEPESVWKKMRIEVEALKIPKDPSDEKCVQIYAALFDMTLEDARALLLNSNH